jgi:hypothetical protein
MRPVLDRPHDFLTANAKTGQLYLTAVVQKRGGPLSQAQTMLSSCLISLQGLRRKKPAKSGGAKWALSDQRHRVKSEAFLKVPSRCEGNTLR